MEIPPLSNFTQQDLCAYDFPGTDAAVVFVADGQAPSPIVQQILERSSLQRWYPVAGGHNAKIPWQFAEDHTELFQREAMGWDHEHCDFCEETVTIGERSWTADAEVGFYLFCGKCYASLRPK